MYPPTWEPGSWGNPQNSNPYIDDCINSNLLIFITWLITTVLLVSWFTKTSLFRSALGNANTVKYFNYDWIHLLWNCGPEKVQRWSIHCHNTPCGCWRKYASISVRTSRIPQRLKSTIAYFLTRKILLHKSCVLIFHAPFHSFRG